MRSVMHSIVMRGRRVRVCRQGGVAVEFAFVLPVLLLLTMGVLEFSMIWTVNTMLDGGLRQAARFGLTGFEPDGGMSREERIKDLIVQNGHGLVDKDKIEVSQFIYPSFDQIGEPEPFTDENGNGQYDSGEGWTDVNGNDQWDPDMGKEGVGGPSEIVLYTVRYEWPLLTPLMRPLIGQDGAYSMESTIALRNEPF